MKHVKALHQVEEKWHKPLFIGLAILCLAPFLSPPLALLLGIILAQIMPHPFLSSCGKAIKYLLQFSVIGLGFGMNANAALQAGKEGFVFTVASIFGTLFFGVLFGKFLKIDKVISFLISGGTAICGGSAIAALSPIIKADQKQISVALGVIFILNSIALFVFPLVGDSLRMSQSDFGLWCAIAIHDTSSVVGAAAKYGDEALQMATTVKLARALWIIPVALISAVLFKTGDTKIKIPYFIGGFILAVIVNTYIPVVQVLSPYIVGFSKAGLTLTLFLVGSGLSFKRLKTVGLRPILQGSLLWVLISVVTLLVIVNI